MLFSGCRYTKFGEIAIVIRLLEEESIAVKLYSIVISSD